ncbi:MAG: D-glycerate dehydrogenase [Cyanobacteria bacterium P01_A01_bin.123]
MSQFSVFVTRRLPTDLDALNEIATVDVWPERQPPPYDILRQKAAQVDGLLCLLTDRIDAALISASPNLKVISQMAVGFDNIDVAAATARGIPVGNTPGVLTEATADLTWALLMATARQVVAGDRFTRSGAWTTWEPDLLLGPDVAGATLGILGFGRIGQAVARRAQGFGMTVYYCGRQPVDKDIARSLDVTFLEFEPLLQKSDFVTIHTPLTPGTHHLFDAAAFAQMKPTARLINTARGAIVDSDALYQALKTGQIAGAAIDVTEPEPIPIDSRLLSLDNLIITPHIGSASVQTRRKMADIAIENLTAGLRSEQLIYCVNPEIYSKR